MPRSCSGGRPWTQLELAVTLPSDSDSYLLIDLALTHETVKHALIVTVTTGCYTNH